MLLPSKTYIACDSGEEKLKVIKYLVGMTGKKFLGIITFEELDSSNLFATNISFPMVIEEGASINAFSSKPPGYKDLITAKDFITEYINDVEASYDYSWE